jgi:hypothetical protein
LTENISSRTSLCIRVNSIKSPLNMLNINYSITLHFYSNKPRIGILVHMGISAPFTCSFLKIVKPHTFMFLKIMMLNM